MAFADATAIVAADFSKFQREFGPALRNAVNKALPSIIRTFTKAGRDAGKAFVAGFAKTLEGTVTAARRVGKLAGAAFEKAAEERTKDIDVSFKIPEARAAVLGRQFRNSVAKQTQAIPVSFASKPSARVVGTITGRRFRAGAMEFTTNIPVTFRVDRVEQLGTRAGQRFRTAAERETRNVQARINIPKPTSDSSNSTSFFSSISRLAGGATRAIVSLRGALSILGVVGIVPVTALIGELASAVGIIAILPALLFSAAAGFAVLGASMSRIGEIAQQSFLPAFKGLGDQVARVTTAGFGKQFENLGRTLDGPVTQGALKVASALNLMITRILQFGQTRETADAVRKVFDSTAISIRILAENLPTLLAGFRDIGVVALPILNEMAVSLNTAIGRFGEFLTASAKSGQATAWIQNARVTLAQLGQIIGNVGTILGSVFSAAQTVGGGVLNSLLAITTAAADFATSVGGVEAFTAIFSTLRDISAAVTPVIKALLNALAPIISAALPALQPLLSTLSTLAVTLIGALGPAILALKPLLDGLVTGLVGLLAPLQPIIVQLGGILTRVIGPIATALGGLFAQLGPVIGELVAGLATALMPLLEALVPIVEELLKQIQPFIPTFIELIPPITEVVVALTPLVEVIAQLAVVMIQMSAPILKAVAAFQAFIITKATIPLFQKIAEGLRAIAEPVRSVIPPLKEFGDFISNLTLEDIGRMFTEAFDAAAAIVGGFVDKVKTFVTNVQDFFLALPGKILSFLASLPARIAGLFALVVNAVFTAIGRLIGFFITLPARIVAAVLKLKDDLILFFANLWIDITSGTTSFLDNAIAFFQALGPRIVTAVQNLGPQLGAFFTNLWNRITTTFREGIARVLQFFHDLPSRIATFGVSIFNAGKALIGRLLDGLVSLGSRGLGFVDQIGRAIKKFINDNVIGALERGLNDSLPFDIHLPRLAKGAFLTKPTVALIAEEGPEVVLPLNNPSRARDLAAESGIDRILGGSSTPVFNITVLIGTTEISDIVRVEVDEALDTQGQQIAYGTRGVI